MFKSTTDYSAYPTVAGLTNNDRKKLYRRPLSEGDILKRFEKYDQEIKILKESFEAERQGFRSRIILLENKVTKLEAQRKEAEETTSNYSIIDAIKESFNNNTVNNTREEILNLKPGQYYTMGSYGGEKIQWKVLKVEDGKALLLSEKGLDSRPYYKVYNVITWENCNLREWLNRDFVNQAFSTGEKQKLATTQVRNPNNSKFGTNGGNITRDRVFLLSIDEVKEYFKTDEERICYPTEYAKKQGAQARKSSGSCWWWLRSPGLYSSFASFVSNVGMVSENGNFVNDDHVVVRPALWINL